MTFDRFRCGYGARSWVAAGLLAATCLTACGDDDDGDGVVTDAGTRLDAAIADAATMDGAAEDAATADASRDGAADDGATGDGAVGDGAVGDGAVSDAGMPLTPAQSAAVITAVNEGEIALAMLADDRADAAEVESFAERMITDHTAAQEMLEDWLDSESVTPMANPVSVMLASEAMQLRGMLMPLDGAAFDRAYMESQVMMHAEVVMLIDSRLLPGATGEFRTLLMSIRDDIEEHRALAEEILGLLPNP